MSEVAEHFVHLEARAREIQGSQLLTRPLGLEVGSHETLVAIDLDGLKHLLVPVASPVVDVDNVSEGVTLGSRVLRVGSDDVTYADLHCRIPSLDLVFEHLVEDVINRLTVDRTAPIATCRKVLDDWRALLKMAGQTVARETVLGLVGELEVLRLLAQQNPVRALDAWRGPSKSVHDFVHEAAEIEVKTTSSVDGNFINISNIDQLDPALVPSLYLVVVHVREDTLAPTLDERIDELIDLGLPRDAFLAKVASTGYVYESGAAMDDRYRTRSLRAWLIGDSFPGLRREELGDTRLKGVSKVRYELALDAAPSRMSDEEFNRFVTSWMDAK